MRSLPSLAVFAALILAGQLAAAQDDPQPTALSPATVHALDSTGAPVADAEVELSVIRADGTEDRRLGTTDHEGAAVFDDVRADCTQIRAAVRVGSTRVQGSPRPCGQTLEVFVVMDTPRPAPERDIASPATAPLPPEPRQPMPEPAPPPASAVDWNSGWLYAAPRLGLDLCQDQFANDRASCGDGGLGFSLTAALRARTLSTGLFSVWAGLDIGYRFFTGNLPTSPTYSSWKANALAVGLAVAPGLDWRRLHARVSLVPLGYLRRAMTLTANNKTNTVGVEGVAAPLGGATGDATDKIDDMYLAGALELSVSLTPTLALGGFGELLTPLGVGANVKRASGFWSLGALLAWTFGHRS